MKKPPRIEKVARDMSVDRKVAHVTVSQDEATRGMKWARVRYLRAESNKLWDESVALRNKSMELEGECEEIERELSKP